MVPTLEKFEVGGIACVGPTDIIENPVGCRMVVLFKDLANPFCASQLEKDGELANSACLIVGRVKHAAMLC